MEDILLTCAYFSLPVLLGLFPAIAAHRKGYNFYLWWFFGAMVFVLALPIAAFMKPNPKAADKIAIQSGMKKCPNCAEFIKSEAKICRFCKTHLESSSPTVACPLCGMQIPLSIIAIGANTCPGCRQGFVAE